MKTLGETVATRPKFGFTLWDVPVREQVDLAVIGEQLGYDLVVIGEHVVMPMGYQSHVPNYSSDASRAHEETRTVAETTLLYDLFTVAGAMFQATSRISIMTGVHLLALRQPLLSALGIRTLHELSNGRFMLGVAAGWNREEFAAIGIPFEERGSRLDEGITVVRSAMEGGAFEHAGEHFSFPPVQISATRFDVPIIVGGNAPPALRRAARLGDGYFASGENDIDELLRKKATIDAMRKEFGTDNRPFQHWLKLTRFDREGVDHLVAAGHDRFVLYGGDLWGLERHSFEERCHRLASVAAAFGIVPPERAS